MADNDLSLQFSIDSDAAVEGVSKVNTALEGTATAAAEAKPALSALDQAEQDLQTHLDKLANATGPRTLIREASQAQVALIEFKAAALAAGMSEDEFAAKTRNASAAILDGATKSAQFTRALGELRQQGMLAANQLEGLRATGGNLSGMFQSMYKTGSDLEKGIGAIGIGAGIGMLAFKGAEMAGEELSKALVGLVEGYDALKDKEQAAMDKGELLRNVMAALSAGHIELGKNVTETIFNYQLFLVASGKAGIAAEQLAQFLKDIKPPQNMAEATKDIEAFGAALQGAMQKGPADAALFLAAQKGVMDKMVQYYATIGKEVPADLQQVVDAQKQAVAAQKLLTEQGAQNAIESFAKIAAARQAADTQGVKSTQAAVTNAENEMKALNAETVSAEEYSRRKKAIYEAETAAVAAAASAQALADAKADLEQAKLQKSMDLSQIAFGDVAKAAGDYAKDIANGVTPSEALSKATEALRKTIETTGEALPQLNDSVQGLWKQFDSLAAKLGAADPVFAAKQAQLAAMTDSLNKANGKLTDMGVIWDTLCEKFTIKGTALDTLIIQIGNIAKAAGTAGAALGGGEGAGGTGAIGLD